MLPSAPSARRWQCVFGHRSVLGRGDPTAVPLHHRLSRIHHQSAGNYTTCEDTYVLSRGLFPDRPISERTGAETSSLRGRTWRCLQGSAIPGRQICCRIFQHINGRPLSEHHHRSSLYTVPEKILRQEANTKAMVNQGSGYAQTVAVIGGYRYAAYLSRFGCVDRHISRVRHIVSKPGVLRSTGGEAASAPSRTMMSLPNRRRRNFETPGRGRISV